MPFTKRYGPILGRFNDFSQGDYGSLSGRHANPGMFAGLNCVVYLDHSIGPRPGARNVSPGFVAGVFPVNLFAFGQGEDISTVYGIDAAGDVWWTEGNPIGSGIWHQVGTSLNSPPTALDWVDDGTVTYVTSLDDAVYVMDLAGHTIRPLTGTPAGGTAIAQFGEHLVIGGATATSRQLQWTDPNNFDSWPALNFLNIGHPHDLIRSLQVQKGVLVVTMADSSIYQITGTLGVNEVVRRFSSPAPRSAHIGPHRVNQDKRGRLWRKGRVWEPESFDGANLAAIPYLDQWMRTDISADDMVVTAGAQIDDVCFVGLKGGTLIQHHGAWTKHAFPWPAGTVDPMAAFYDGDETLVMAANDPVQPPQLFGLDLDIERPPMVSEGDATEDAHGGAAPVAEFTTPEVRDSAGRNIFVRMVVVRFTKYLTGAAASNHFDLAVNAIDVYESEQPDPNVTDGWDEDNALAPPGTAGTRQEISFGLNEGGDVGAVSVTVSNMRGVKIDEIIVYGGIEPQRSES